MPAETAESVKFIVLSSVGLTKSSHKRLPFLLRLFYGGFLHVPHVDKLGMERAVAYAANLPWTEGEPEAGIFQDGWKSQLPQSGFLKHALVVRAALLTDGKCIGDEKDANAYRASKEELGGYTVSRKDVAHFIVEQALKDWPKYEGWINVGY